MSDVIQWFTTELHKLGYAGLEGVYDYLTTMSDSEVMEYLESLLGSEKRIKKFASAYVHRRSQNRETEPAPTTGSSSSDAKSDWAQGALLPSKPKRNKGKARKASGNELKRNQKESKSFAKAVSSVNTEAYNSAQAKAIRDAPAERMRQQVREYRKTKRPINCIHCGKIECPVPEDGACSFCRAPLFSTGKASEARPTAMQSFQSAQTHAEDEQVFDRHLPSRAQAMRNTCLVLGRYIRRPVKENNVYVQPELTDLAGNAVRLHQEERKEAINTAHISSSDGVNSSSRNASELRDQSKKRLTIARPQQTGPLSKEGPLDVQGRLLIDDLRSSVYLPGSSYRA